MDNSALLSAISARPVSATLDDSVHQRMNLFREFIRGRTQEVRKSTAAAILEDILALQMPAHQVLPCIERQQSTGMITPKEAIMLGLVAKALDGNMDAIKYIITRTEDDGMEKVALFDGNTLSKVERDILEQAGIVVDAEYAEVPAEKRDGRPSEKGTGTLADPDGIFD